MEKKFFITIDGGTTNTRVRLVDLSSLSIVAKVSENIGAKDTRLKGKEALEEALIKCISRVIEEGSISSNEIMGIAASGMITSEAGLLEVQHVIAPAGLEEVASNIVEKLFERIWPKPILFIPGVKTIPKEEKGSLFEQIKSCDIMRGEECESFGIIELEKIEKPAIIVIPGSHTKFIFIDENKRIKGSLTTITGELASALVSSTLLGRSLEDLKLSYLDEEFLLNGFKMARQCGLTRSLFMIRLLHLMSESNTDQRRSFLWGALGSIDILALEKDQRFKSLIDQGEANIFIGGTGPLREIFGKLLNMWISSEALKINVKVLSYEVAEKASAIGAILVALKRLKLKLSPPQTF